MAIPFSLHTFNPFIPSPSYRMAIHLISARWIRRFKWERGVWRSGANTRKHKEAEWEQGILRRLGGPASLVYWVRSKTVQSIEMCNERARNCWTDSLNFPCSLTSLIDERSTKSERARRLFKLLMRVEEGPRWDAIQRKRLWRSTRLRGKSRGVCSGVRNANWLILQMWEQIVTI